MPRFKTRIAFYPSRLKYSRGICRARSATSSQDPGSASRAPGPPGDRLPVELHGSPRIAVNFRQQRRQIALGCWRCPEHKRRSRVHNNDIAVHLRERNPGRIALATRCASQREHAQPAGSFTTTMSLPDGRGMSVTNTCLIMTLLSDDGTGNRERQDPGARCRRQTPPRAF